MPGTSNVLYLPTHKPRCQVDGQPIFKENEPKGRLYLVNGYPMCAMHRLMRITHGKKLDYRQVFGQHREQEKADLDRLVAEEKKRQAEAQRVREIAAESQDQAAKVNPNTKLIK